MNRVGLHRVMRLTNDSTLVQMEKMEPFHAPCVRQGFINHNLVQVVVLHAIRFLQKVRQLVQTNVPTVIIRIITDVLKIVLRAVMPREQSAQNVRGVSLRDRDVCSIAQQEHTNSEQTNV